jgi:3-oxoadipate enol-lactonase
MLALSRPFGRLHVRVDGPADAPAVVFANSLGTDLRLWDAVLPLLPLGLRYIRYDKRGHGLSDLGGGDVITDHAEDAIAVITEIARGPVVFVGLSIGGMIAQVVAEQRPDLLRAVVLSNTCAKLGTAQSWQDRIALIERDGLAALGPAVMERWFAPAFRATPACALWQNMLIRTPQAGYIAACHALAQADQRAATARLRLPALVIAGSEDGATPPDQVRETAGLIADAAFHVIEGAGHLPCTEAPSHWAALVTPFLQAHAAS